MQLMHLTACTHLQKSTPVQLLTFYVLQNAHHAMLLELALCCAKPQAVVIRTSQGQGNQLRATQPGPVQQPLLYWSSVRCSPRGCLQDKAITLRTVSVMSAVSKSCAEICHSCSMACTSVIPPSSSSFSTSDPELQEVSHGTQTHRTDNAPSLATAVPSRVLCPQPISLGCRFSILLLAAALSAACLDCDGELHI